jgi:hypothetical protein
MKEQLGHISPFVIFLGHLQRCFVRICTVKLDEEKSKYAGLAQKNCFGSA